MKRLFKAAAVAAVTVITAICASITSFAGAPEPICIGDDTYVWESSAELIIIDKSGNIIGTKGYKATSPDPLSAGNLKELKYLGKVKATSQSPEMKYYQKDDALLVIWKSDVDIYPNAAELLKEHSADMYFEGNIFMKRNGSFRKVGNKTYYYDQKGRMLKGWQIIDGKKYFFKSNGEMAVQSLTINGVRYYFSDNGVCRGKYSGLVTLKSTGTKYYYKDGVKQTGWVTRKGATYYFIEESGKMLTGGVLIKDGYVYNFSESGEWDGSAITYSEYKKEQDNKRPQTVGELVKVMRQKNESYVDIWRVDQSGDERPRLNETTKFLALLEESADVKLEYFDGSDDEIDLPDDIYSGDEDYLIRFMGNGTSLGGWYFSKDEDGNGYIYSLSTWFGAKLEGSEAYDLLDSIYCSKMGISDKNAIAPLYVSNGWCLLSDGELYSSVQNDPSWAGVKLVKGKFLTSIRQKTSETDLTRIVSGSANLLPVGTKLYGTNSRTVILADVDGTLIPYVRIVEG